MRQVRPLVSQRSHPNVLEMPSFLKAANAGCFCLLSFFFLKKKKDKEKEGKKRQDFLCSIVIAESQFRQDGEKKAFLLIQSG